MWFVLGLHVSSSELPEQFYLGDADLFVGMWSRLETTGLFFFFFPLSSSFLFSAFLCFTYFCFHYSLSGLIYTSDFKYTSFFA